MINIVTKDRKRIIAQIDIEELFVELNLVEYSQLLLNAVGTVSQNQIITDFNTLYKLNEHFEDDVLEQQLEVIKQRYGLLVEVEG